MLGPNEFYTQEHIKLDGEGLAYGRVMSALTDAERAEYHASTASEYDEVARARLLQRRLDLYVTGARRAGLTFTGERGSR
jgi:hypothetical protein